MRRPDRRAVADVIWAGAGLAVAYGAMAAIERLRHEPLAESVDSAPEHEWSTGKISRSYEVASVLTVVSLVATSLRLPSWCGPVGIAVQLSGFCLRVWSMRTLGRFYTRALRTVDDQAVVRDGPYRVIRHPGYLGSLLIWTGAGVTARNAAAVAASIIVVGDGYRRRIEAEDDLLIRELPQYAEYAAATGRLLPRLRPNRAARQP